MPHGGSLHANVQPVKLLRDGEGSGGIALGETLGDYGSLGQTLLSDVEDPTSDTLSRQVAGAPDICHDRGWAYAFKINVIITIVAAICFGNQALEAIASDQQLGELGWRRLNETSDTFAWVSFFFVGLGLVALGGGLALGILHSLINYGKPIIWALMTLVTLSWLSAIVRLAAGGNILMAGVIAFFFYAVARFFHRRRARFHFGAANLKVRVTKVSWCQNSAACLGLFDRC